MTSVFDISGVPHKEAVRIDKRNPGTPLDAPPDDVVELEAWFEADGSLVSDPARIAELTAMTAPNQGADHGPDSRADAAD